LTFKNKEFAMTDNNLSGWQYQPYEEDGFYILRPGGPLYAVIEQHGASIWLLLICQTEGPDDPLQVQEHRSLAAAQGAAVPAMLALLDGWRGRLAALQRKQKR
jgi:hypothetical protein